MIQVSIGIPFYNAQDFLEQAILSVLNQDFKSFELLLIDDGCTDRSLDIAYRFQDERIKVIHDGKIKDFQHVLTNLLHCRKENISCEWMPMTLCFHSEYHVN